MPRGSKPGERRGGRQRGTPNRKTALTNAAFVAAASNPDITPLDFLLGIMRDHTVPPELRIRVAQAAAPFVHAKPGNPQLADPMTNAKQIEGTSEFVIEPGLARTLRDDSARLTQFAFRTHSPSAPGGPLDPAEIEEEAMLSARVAETARAIVCPANYGPKEARKDRDRLHHFYCKRISPPSCGGGALSEAEDAEEAQLTARVAAFEESPEGRARNRIVELEFDSFSRALTDTETEELESLRKIYPDLPPDPDDPLKHVMEAYDRALADQRDKAEKFRAQKRQDGGRFDELT
jgi:hypothetical protein